MKTSYEKMQVRFTGSDQLEVIHIFCTDHA